MKNTRFIHNGDAIHKNDTIVAFNGNHDLITLVAALQFTERELVERPGEDVKAHQFRQECHELSDALLYHMLKNYPQRMYRDRRQVLKQNFQARGLEVVVYETEPENCSLCKHPPHEGRYCSTEGCTCAHPDGPDWGE